MTANQGEVSMKLIFLRHAKAEELKNGQKDAERNLTDEGREALHFLGQEISGYFMMQGRVEIWSSDYNRAVQSAEILSKYIPDAAVTTHKSIRKDEFKKLTDRLQATDSDTVIVVGHNPFLEEWFQEITGESVEIHIAEMLTMQYDPKTTKGSLIWRWKPNEVIALCPYRQDAGMPLWSWLEELFFSYHVQISGTRKLFQDTHPNELAPIDVDKETRNVRAMLIGLQPLLHQKQYKKARERYKIGHDQLRKLRRVDVLLASIIESGEYPKFEKALWKKHKTEDKILRKEIYTFASTKNYQKALRAVLKALRNTEEVNKIQDLEALKAFVDNRQPSLHDNVTIDTLFVDASNPDQVEEMVEDLDTAQRWRSAWNKVWIKQGLVDPATQEETGLDKDKAEIRRLDRIFSKLKTIEMLRQELPNADDENLQSEIEAYKEHLNGEIAKG